MLLGPSQSPLFYQSLSANGFTVATAESCTGGMLAEALTAQGGSSAWFRGGVVTYHEDLKTSLLNVPKDLLETCTAVHPDVAKLMACEVRQLLTSTFGLATTGYAGPAGGHAGVPVGTVYIALATPSAIHVERHNFSGNRTDVRKAATSAALSLLLNQTKWSL